MERKGLGILLGLIIFGLGVYAGHKVAHYRDGFIIRRLKNAAIVYKTEVQNYAAAMKTIKETAQTAQNTVVTAPTK